MTYMGSKARLATRLLPIVLAERKAGQTYVEPFVGGGNLIWRVDGPRIGGDVNGYMISLLRALGDGWPPPTEITAEEYRSIRTNPQSYEPALVGFVGGPGSFGGKWMAGHLRNRANGRSRLAESARSCERQAAGLRGVQFHHCGYQSLPIPPASLIYCDPPYAGTEGYGMSWDAGKFHEWCRKMANEGHTIFVSEYDSPFRLVAKWEFATTLDRNRRKPRIERLYRVDA